MTPKPMRMDALCQQVAREMEEAFPGAQIEVQTEGAVEGVWDEQRIAQAVSNLVSNGIKYGSPGIPVRLQVSNNSSGEVVVAVHNAGPTIPDKFRDTLFQPLSAN